MDRLKTALSKLLIILISPIVLILAIVADLLGITFAEE